MRPAITAAVIAGLALGGLAYGVLRSLGDVEPSGPAWAALTTTSGQAPGAPGMQGHPALIFFGYTHCPDFCPTALTTAGAALAALGPDAARIQIVFITLDPARDTPEVLRAYLEAFDPRIVGLTGAPDAIRAAAGAFGVRFEKRGEGADYGIDHTAAFVLTDARGRLSAAFSYGASPEALAAAVRKSLAASSV